MSSEQDVLKELKKQAGDEIMIDENAFRSVEDVEQANAADLSGLGGIAETISPSMDIPVKSIEERMSEIGLSKDVAIDMIMELSDNGFIEESVSLFGGKFKAKFRTAKITDSKKFVDLFDAMDISTQAKGEYYLNLYALASILIEYNGTNLDLDDVIARANWIEANLPVPLYKTLIEKANKFHQKIELLNSDEVADFF